MRPWEKNIRKIDPYVPGEQPKAVGIVKLNTNENPYPPAPGVEHRLKHMDTDRLRLYPDPKISQLVDCLAEYYHLESDQIFVGVGSDDVLSVAFLTFFNSGKPILFPDITYSFYPVWSKLYQIPFVNPALDDNFHIVKEDYYQDNGGIVIANPNAPTSLAEELDIIEDIIKHNPEVIVIIDEAYVDFAKASAVELIHKYDNLLVVQTFSKSRSMAGMRIGYAIGHPQLIKALNDVKYSINSYTLNLPAIECGIEAVRDVEYFKEGINRILATRKYSEERLRELGFSFPASSANFIFATHQSVPAKVIFQELRKHNIYVRYFDLPRIDNYLRITIGTQEDMDHMFKILQILL